MMKENLLILFIKYPSPGAVKQRLAQHIGNKRAAEIYKIISEMVLNKITPEGTEEYVVEICFSPEEDEQLIRQWLAEYDHFHPQQGRDLGERMLKAFERAFGNGYKRIVLIGSDCPDISREIILKSFILLHEKQVVLGPAYDGGYYLIGLREPVSKLFCNIDWGTANVLNQTCEKINEADLSFELLPKLRDIDRVEDLHYYNFAL